MCMGVLQGLLLRTLCSTFTAGDLACFRYTGIPMCAGQASV
jgi:hypothetical protein